MDTKLKVALALLAGVLVFGAGWFSRGTEIQRVEVKVPQIVNHTETQVQTKVVDHVVTKTVTKTVKEPSGASTTTVTQVVDKAETKNQAKEVEAKSVASLPPPTKNWSLGVNWTPRIDPKVYYPTSMELGRRVVGNAWVTGAFDWHAHQALVGVRYEF